MPIGQFARMALAVLACLASPAMAAEPEQGPAAMRAVAAGNADFGVELFRKLAAEEGNVFISPISIAGVLGPLMAGSGGATRDAIGSTMHFPEAADLHGALGGLLRGLERDEKGTTISIANALWADKGFALKPAYVTAVRSDYDSSLERLDFDKPVAAADRINRWAAKETRDRITQVIDPDKLSSATGLILTNAVYLLADWQSPFRKESTSEQPFYLRDGRESQVRLMRQTERYRYLEGENFQLIDIPYKDERLSMSIFLPKQRDGMPAFETQLTGPGFRDWLAKLDREPTRKVHLLLPSLEIGGKYGLAKPLVELGMGRIFNDAADFRGIADLPLAVGGVVQATYLRMDEKGTEAAAVTAVEIIVTSASREEIPTFRADHPFFIAIRDKTSGAILFMGRIEEPKAAVAN